MNSRRWVAVLSALAALTLACSDGSDRSETPSPTSERNSPTAPPTETATIRPTETPEPTQTPLPPRPARLAANLEGYKHELGLVTSFGDVTFAITKELMERTMCPEDTGSRCHPMTSIEANVAEYPDAAIRIEDGVLYGLYLAWRNEPSSGRSEVSFEEFRTRRASGEPLLFTTFANPGNANELFRSRLTVNASRPVTVVMLAHKGCPAFGQKASCDTFISPQRSLDFGFRVFPNGELFIEWDFGNRPATPEGAGHHYTALWVAQVLIYLGDRDLQAPLSARSYLNLSLGQISQLSQDFLSLTSTYFVEGFIRDDSPEERARVPEAFPNWRGVLVFK